MYRQGEIDLETVFVDGTKIEANANRYSKEKARAALLELEVTDSASIDLLRREARKQRHELTKAGLETLSGTGHRKSLWQKWEEYETHLERMGPGRNSYAKTDPDATFMRMKDDHMRNGQLKPGYNVQLAVNSEYITGYGVFPDRTDSGALIPFLQALCGIHGERYKSVTADAGYESHENYVHLEEYEQLSYIKPTDHERRKKKNSWVGRMEDMAYEQANDTFTCQNGKPLTHTGQKTRKSGSGFESKVDLYTCTDCTGCILRERCSRAENASKKTLGVCWDFVRLRALSRDNMTNELGTQFWVNCSIQCEGTFGVLKQDWAFRRFLTRGTTGVLVEIGMLAFAFNLKKLHTKLAQNRPRAHLFPLKSA